jgi:hypothetical protein
MVRDPGISLPLSLLSVFATLAVIMEHDNSSRGSCVGSPGEGMGCPPATVALIPALLGYGQAQNMVS